MKILLLALLASCATPKAITPKVAKIENRGTHYHVYVWYYDSWFMAGYKTLPDSIRKGRRVTLYPGDTKFKRVSNPTRPWN